MLSIRLLLRRSDGSHEGSALALATQCNDILGSPSCKHPSSAEEEWHQEKRAGAACWSEID